MFKIWKVILLQFFICFTEVASQGQTVGLFINTENSFEGYTLFAPMKSKTTYLINNNGQLIHSWESDGNPGLSAYLLPNGNLLRTQSVVNQTINAGGGGGKVVEMDWEGNKIWEFTYSSSSYRLHHDIEYLPNGNILMIAWANKSKEQALSEGRKSELIFDNALWYTQIIEVKPTGNDTGEIVWEWNAWDHLIQNYDSTKNNYGVVEEHPELINLNFVENPNAPNNNSDWLHTNGIDYNVELDQILLSVRGLSEIWIIDHSTNTAEAAGHSGGNSGRGGDLIYRWGNPRTYGRGSTEDRKLFYQHNAEWIPKGYPGEGNITVFNNGDRNLRSYSSIDEIVPPYDESGNYIIETDKSYAPDMPIWSYSDNNFYAENISGVQRFENGNTLICSGPFGEFFEITSSKELVWKYINPVTDKGPIIQNEAIPGNNMGFDNLCFRAIRYSPNYSAFEGKDLTPKGNIELTTTNIETNQELPNKFALLQNYPNPFNPSTVISFNVPETSEISLKIFNLLGSEVGVIVQNQLAAGSYEFNFNAEDLTSGIYFYTLHAVSESGINFYKSKKMVLIK